jgi:hypothetical protein
MLILENQRMWQGKNTSILANESIVNKKGVSLVTTGQGREDVQLLSLLSDSANSVTVCHPCFTAKP